MNRFLWLIVAGVVALVLTWPLNLLDDWIVGQGWFPKNNLYAGLNGAIFAGIISASIAQSKPRKIMGGVAGVIFAVTVIWAMRYIIGLADPSSITIDQSKGYTQVYWTLMFACGLGTGWLSTMRVSQGRFWAIQFLLVVVSVIAADVATGAMGIDVGTMNRVLYYQTVEIEVHQPVDDADLLYSLKPGARLGGEGPWGLRTVTVNQWGARSPNYSQAKPEGRRRTLVFGGSTLYGAGVGNAQATPGAMDALLGPNHEVWNFGVCAYNTTQSAHLAMRMMDTLDPDHIIVMITNTGRRAFMGGPTHQNADKSKYFRENPYLYLENFPPFGIDESLHQRALTTSALYRTYTAWIRAQTNPDTTYSDRADHKAVALLEAKAAQQGVEVLYVLSPSRGSEIGPAQMGVPADRWLDLHLPSKGSDYQQAHPAPEVLYDYAVRIVAWMKERS